MDKLKVNTFNKLQKCEYLHTQKTHQIFFNPESNIWIVMTVNVGWIRKQNENGFITEYQSESVQDEVLRSNLTKSYNNFRFQNLSFLDIIEKENKDILKETLDLFFDNYIMENDVISGDTLSLCDGISFLPLEKKSFLTLHSILSFLQSMLPSIVHTSFLYRNQFAWCGFKMEDLQQLSRFILCKLDHLSPDVLCQSPTPAASTSQGNRKFSCNSRFIGEGDTPSYLVYIRNKDNEVRPHYLVMYALAGVVVCLSFAYDNPPEKSDFDQISKLLEGNISQMASDLGEQQSTSGKHSQENLRYIYHNHTNMATKSNLQGVNAIPPQTMQTILDMHSDILKTKNSELTVKTADNFWIVGKCCNGRESYVIINHKNANLVEISDEVRRFSNSEWGNIFNTD